MENNWADTLVIVLVAKKKKKDEEEEEKSIFGVPAFTKQSIPRVPLTVSVHTNLNTLSPCASFLQYCCKMWLDKRSNTDICHGFDALMSSFGKFHPVRGHPMIAQPRWKATDSYQTWHSQT